MFQDQAGELTDEIRELLASYNSVVSFLNLVFQTLNCKPICFHGY